MMKLFSEHTSGFTVDCLWPGRARDCLAQLLPEVAGQQQLDHTFVLRNRIITLASSPPPANLDLATASAMRVLAQTMSCREKVIESADGQAVTTLSAASTEHQKPEARQRFDVSLILAEV